MIYKWSRIFINLPNSAKGAASCFVLHSINLPSCLAGLQSQFCHVSGRPAFIGVTLPVHIRCISVITRACARIERPRYVLTRHLCIDHRDGLDKKRSNPDANQQDPEPRQRLLRAGCLNSRLCFDSIESSQSAHLGQPEMSPCGFSFFVEQCQHHVSCSGSP